ncbi:hypothetical protein KHQ06_26335 [Nocardia tengchongensis]|uniref:Uncharacterized protein n=1 Tax=Nocardia tengchongensis TaxID=2055889 RepID=A0ABX8CIM1_9NOCA|nr:hypothetical protein [Nocardia tengchongensis]QVI19822.1 hypothetical protein KHQ06_26335 [Nocardia tengchongensis]
MKSIDLNTLAAQRDPLRWELSILDQAVAAVPPGARHGELDKLSREAFTVLARRIYTLDHPPALRPDRRRER